jgi:hypothetical protein
MTTQYSSKYYRIDWNKILDNYNSIYGGANIKNYENQNIENQFENRLT